MTQSTGVVASDVANETCCPHCGYSLRGLTLPRPCPECGTPFESEATCHAAAVAWYASWNGFWFRRPPPMVMPHLADPACRRVAKKRLLLGVVLPWLVVMLAMFGLNSIVVVRAVDSWYEMPSRPAEKQGATRDTYEDRLLNFNLDVFWAPNQPSTHQREVSRGITLDWPRPDAMALILWLTPPITTLLALFLLVLALYGFEYIQRHRGRPVGVLSATLAATVFLAPWLLPIWMERCVNGIVGAVGEVHRYDGAVRAQMIVFGEWSEAVVIAAILGGAYALTRIVRGWYPPLRGPNRLLCFVGALVVGGGLLIGTCLGAAWVIATLA